MVGKLNLESLIKRALKINCKRIDNERKVSGKNDFNIIMSIDFENVIFYRYPHQVLMFKKWATNT